MDGYFVRAAGVTILFRRRSTLIPRVLALVLLFAQLGAEAHAYSHLINDPQGVPAGVQDCGKCLSYAPLLSAVGGSSCTAVTFRDTVQGIDLVRPTALPDLSPYSAFQPRAPPELH